MNDRSEKSERRHRILRRIWAPLLWMATIYLFSAQPNLSTDLGLADLIGRKIAHMVSFGTLAYLWFWTLRGSVSRPMLTAAVIAIAYACTDEYHQSFVEGRHGSPVDVAIDSVGVAVAAALARRQAARRFDT